MIKITPRGSYIEQLADSIRDYHRALLSKRPGRRKKGTFPEHFPITQESLANFTQIDAGELSRYLNGHIPIPKEPLFRLISMPWVSEEAAQSWLFLWLASELDRYSIEDNGEHYPHLKTLTPPGWTANRNFDRLSESLATLSAYSPTLGVIHQIEHARRRRRVLALSQDYHVPEQGPRINRNDFHGLIPANKLQKVIHDYKQQEPLTAFSIKFAEGLAHLEAEEHDAELNSYLHDEAVEGRTSFEAQASESNIDVLVEAVLGKFGVGVVDRGVAAQMTKVVIELARDTPASDPDRETGA